MQATGAIATEADVPRRRPGLRGWLLLLPLLLWLGMFVVAPSLILLVYSFCSLDEFSRVDYTFTLENYIRAFDKTYGMIFLRSVGYAALTTVLCVLIGYPVAYYIGKCPEDRRNLLLMLVMIPFWTSFLIRTYAWITILSQQGLLNAFLLSSGLTVAPWSILYTPWAVVIGLVYTYVPFMILPIYGSVEKMDNAMLEAAFDLGAGPVRAFSEVVIPLTRPGIVAGILLVFVPSIGMFAITDLMGGGRVPMIGDVIMNQFLSARNWPFGAALGVLLMLMFAAAYWLMQKSEEARD